MLTNARAGTQLACRCAHSYFPASLELPGILGKVALTALMSEVKGQQPASQPAR